MSRRRNKKLEARQARERLQAAGPQARRADASVLQPRHMLLLYLNHLHTGKSVEQIAASYGLDPEGLRERFEYTERALDGMLPAGKSMSERIKKSMVEYGQEAGEDSP